MRSALKVGLLALGCCLAPLAQATIDCQRAQTRRDVATKPAVIAYRDEAAASASEAELVSLERELASEVLSDYWRLLPRPAGVAGLAFVICSQKTGSTLEDANDVIRLQNFNVTVAIWRERGQPGVFYAVVPQTRDGNPPPPLEDTVVAAAASASAPGGGLPKFWAMGLQRGDALMRALVGFGFGNRLLDAKDFLHAKLVLCTSKKDLQRSLDSLLRPPRPAAELLARIEESLLVAEKRIADTKEAADQTLRANKDLRDGIQAACPR
ncbi:MAG TPA: hypothetical protein VGF12_21645 [Roseateles sp.]|uniref:hypothetical protein n=1 Tax=Roseateles sp. TaxID=1971397 RepID=UPI002ED96437